MPHRHRSNRDGSPEFERYVKPLSISELNMRFLNNPKLSRNQRTFIVKTYRKEHPLEKARERRVVKYLKRHGLDTNANRKKFDVLTLRRVPKQGRLNPGRQFKPRQVPRGSRRFKQKLKQAQTRRKRRN